MVLGFKLSDLSVINCTLHNFQTTNNKDFTIDLISNKEGELTVDLLINSITDQAGNGNTKKGNQFSITYDVTQPTTIITSAIENLTNLKTIPMKISFSEEVVGFDISDFILINCTVKNLHTTNNKDFTVDIIPNKEGELRVDLLSNVITDKTGNGNTKANKFSITYDTTRPTVNLSTSKNKAVNSENIVLTIKFSEKIIGLDESKIILNQGNISNLKSTDSTVFTADLPPIETGKMTIKLSDSEVTDLAGNRNTAANEISIVYTGIKEFKSMGYKIYPNPVKDFLTISSSTLNEEILIQIININGKIIYSNKLMSPFKNKIDLSNYIDALYFIRFKSNLNDVTQKIILRK